jgi:hypothetical protein
VLDAIGKLDTMRKGSINRQINKVKHKDGSISENGPYLTLTWKDHDGKTHTKSIPEDQLEYIKGEIANFREFQRLTTEYVNLAEQKSALLMSGTEDERTKKNGKHRMRETTR